MKGHYSGEAGVDWHLSKETATFVGPPNACRGELTLVNVSDSKVKVRTLQAQAASRPRKNIPSIQSSQISLFARVAPHSQAKTVAALHLASDTAPGKYSATVLCGKQKQAIEINVLEYRESEIQPSHLRFSGVSGETKHCQITITNHGNVDLALGDVGMVWLRESDWIGRTLVYTLRETNEGDNYESFANRLLKSFREEIIPPARVQFEPSAKKAVGAGKTLCRTMSLIFPPGLKKGRRYLGFIKINEDRIWLEVFCTGTAKESAQKT